MKDFGIKNNIFCNIYLRIYTVDKYSFEIHNIYILVIISNIVFREGDYYVKSFEEISLVGFFARLFTCVNKCYSLKAGGLDVHCQ